MDFKPLNWPEAGLVAAAADTVMVVATAGDSVEHLDAALVGSVKQAIKAGDLEWKAGKTLLLLQPTGFKAARVLLTVAASDDAKAVRAALQAGWAALKSTGAQAVAVAFCGSLVPSEASAEWVAMTATDAAYLYRHTKPSAPPAVRWARVLVLAPKAAAAAVQAGLKVGQAVGAGVERARECANRPGNHATPTFLADQAKTLAKTYGFKVQVLDRPAIEKLGMGSFLAVAQGSDEAPKFIVLQYQGAAKSKAPVVLVGKGITFDTGGISIKPAAEMDEMKFDMGGAASVLGTFEALGRLQPKVNVVGLIPACENMPSGRAVKPGDVVTSLSGQTIEILNTDAEGRLILCDALTYAERFKPAAVVDIATLTGACVIALGHHHSGLFSSDEPLAAELLSASRRALDPAWRMPLDEEYGEALKSNFADMGNVGGRAGGSITAALFLQKFAKAYPWAHLDIAGTAWKSGAAKGATGRPVPLLTHFLLSRAG